MADDTRKKSPYVLRSRLTLSTEEAQQNDFIFFNNTVFMQGLALTPVIAAANTLRNAVILAIAGVALIIPSRLIGDATVGRIKTRLRIIFYAIFSSMILVPVMIVLSKLFGGSFISVGLYVPLLFVDGAVTWRASVAQREGARHVFRNAFSTAFGYSFAICLVGAVREILGKGTIWDVRLFSSAPFSVASLVPGGFLITAVIAAFWQSISSFFKKMVFTGGKAND